MGKQFLILTMRRHAEVWSRCVVAGALLLPACADIPTDDLQGEDDDPSGEESTIAESGDTLSSLNDDATSDEPTSETEGDGEQAPPLGLAVRELSLGVACFNPLFDGISCGFGSRGRLDGQTFQCERVERNGACPFGWLQQERKGRDICSLLFGNKPAGCAVGESLEVDSQGKRDRCRKVVHVWPNGCFGSKIGCPSGVKAEFADGKFRCVTETRPVCAVPGQPITVVPNRDKCGLGLSPVCHLQVTTLLAGYVVDRKGNRDMCVHRGWPIPSVAH